MTSLKVLDNELELYSLKLNALLTKDITKTEWLQLDFEDRTLSWSKNEINFKIQIYPTIDGDEITGWNFWSVAWKDKLGKRYWLNRFQMKNVSKELIIENFSKSIISELNYLEGIKEDELIAANR